MPNRQSHEWHIFYKDINEFYDDKPEEKARALRNLCGIDIGGVRARIIEVSMSANPSTDSGMMTKHVKFRIDNISEARALDRIINSKYTIAYIKGDMWRCARYSCYRQLANLQTLWITPTQEAILILDGIIIDYEKVRI